MFQGNLTIFRCGEGSIYTNPKPSMALTTGDINGDFVACLFGRFLVRFLARYPIREFSDENFANYNPLLHLNS